ncbi:MAG TPA: glycoside hydrolase 100 family protein [Azonexus sp.]|nr:glycoside hydrolase 100 family protein [Azonexus sp.]
MNVNELAGLAASSAEDEDLIARCAERATALLHANLGPLGFFAATPGAGARQRGYDRVFGRDAAICAIAAAHCGDGELIAGAERSLLALSAQQAANGQIPKYVDGEENSADFWYLGCIDATLWWLIAVAHLARRVSGLQRRLCGPVGRAIAWLSCQEHQQIFLLQQNEASDWADIMPRSGFVLYSNALWYYVKGLYRLPHASATGEHFNYLFHPFGQHRADYKRLRLFIHFARNKPVSSEMYLSFVNLGYWGEEGDVFGNLLATLFGLADEHRTNRILARIERNQVGAAYPVRVTCMPIGRGDPYWRTYMGRHQQNLEYCYHNGGIWPFVGGFWVLALAAAGRQPQAARELAGLARANAANGWRFTEWFHGLTGQPEGMAGQSWNAAMFLLARHGLDNRVFRRIYDTGEGAWAGG